ncbi:DNA-directed RNA polymerase subunit beta, partial [bacterium]|nr:DNA-directed RNA polymerase subunit beta [bacterium]MBU1025356.1 DNA-directed RNA polymerase subunit beta [bacterium]
MGNITATVLKKTLKELEGIGAKDANTLPTVDYASIPQVKEIPFLIAVQLDSFNWFLEDGLRDLFERIFPIKGYSDNLELEFVDYFVCDPTVTVDECKNRDLSFSAPLRLRLRLHNKLNNTMVEQDVFLGDLPLMTKTGTFVINGAERAVVSQLVRSPGVYFMEKPTQKEAKSYYARIIPNRGAWIEVEYEEGEKGLTIARLDKVKKISVTNLLLALGFKFDINKWIISHEPIDINVEPRFSDLKGMTPPQDIKDPSTGKILAPKNQEISSKVAEEIVEKFESDQLIKFTYKIDDLKMNQNLISTYRDAGIETEKEALIDIYKKLRPGDPPNLETARNLIESRFFDEKKYDLSPVGRYKINKRLGINVPLPIRYLTKIDLLETIRALYTTADNIDDIDHLGNRRIRSVGELIQNHFRKGLLRMERVAKERMATQDSSRLTPQALINTRSVVAVLKEFFGSSQLSQFMDQTNPLAELTHKRRLSALGPGGLSRERAGFEVRDVHHSHYGRICPIESPEGPNIGLIGSLASYAKISEYGFIQTPYRAVKNGKVSQDIEYLTADDEDGFRIAGANTLLDKNNKFVEQRVSVRYRKKVFKEDADEVQLMDVSPMQLVSPTTALIPFLEHDDANRALMGSN